MSRREQKREYKHDRREMKREYRNERRAFRDERRAAKRGYGAPVPVRMHQAPMNNGSSSAYGGGGYGLQGHLYGDQGMGEAYNGAGPSYSSSYSRGLAPQDSREVRRASFDVRDLEKEDSESDSDLPPKYERGDWQPQQSVRHRRSVEVLTAGKRSQ